MYVCGHLPLATCYLLLAAAVDRCKLIGLGSTETLTLKPTATTKWR